MRRGLSASLAGVGLAWLGLGVAAPAALATPVTYEIQASTLSGLGALATGGSPSPGAMMRLLMGGEPKAVRSLQLTLRANGPSPAAPQAEHRIPAGLGLGPSLPLVTPDLSPGQSPAASNPGETSLPRGRLLVFKGCVEGTASREPEVFDFASLVPDQQAIARALARSGSLQGIAASARPVTGVVGHWPHGESSPSIPGEASLVGSHRVSSNYAPVIDFAVERSHDFLPPVQLQATSAQGSWQLSWQAIPTVLGYQALVTGPGRQEGDVVIWTSSERPWNESPMLGAFTLGRSDGAALVRQGVLMGPERTRCTVPAAAVLAMEAAVLQFSAFGAPLRLVAPGPAPAWQVHLDRQAMVMQPLLEGLPSGSSDPSERSAPSGSGAPKDAGPFNLFRGLF